MITVDAQPDDSQEMRITFQEDDQCGNLFGANLNDHQAMQLLIDMTKFLEAKGHNIKRLFELADAKPKFFKRVSQAFFHIIGG